MKKTAPTKAPAAAKRRAELPAGALPPIERGIPIPKRSGAARGPRTAVGRHLERLDVNESFALPAERSGQLSSSAYCCSKRTGRRFAVRRVDEMVRVWRIK